MLNILADALMIALRMNHGNVPQVRNQHREPMQHRHSADQRA